MIIWKQLGQNRISPFGLHLQGMWWSSVIGWDGTRQKEGKKEDEGMGSVNLDLVLLRKQSFAHISPRILKKTEVLAVARCHKILRGSRQNMKSSLETGKNSCWNAAAKLGKHLFLAVHTPHIREQRSDKRHRSWQGQEVRSSVASSTPSCTSPAAAVQSPYTSVDRRVNLKPPCLANFHTASSSTPWISHC